MLFGGAVAADAQNRIAANVKCSAARLSLKRLVSVSVNGARVEKPTPSDEDTRRSAEERR